jgi:two-component system chemotaxis response regulator CheB
MIGRRPPDGRIRVLVVEDSRFMRGVIRQILVSDPQIDVVGLAADGIEALDAVASLTPHVVTMDVNMPHADGLCAVERIMAECPTPIVMISSHTREGSAATIRALELGAVDFIAKPSGSVDDGLRALQNEVIRKVKMAARVRPIRNVVLHRASARAETSGALNVLGSDAPASRVIVGGRNEGHNDWTPCVVIATSTGGPAALLDLIPQVPQGLPASVLIVQHMSHPYTSQLAKELAARSSIPVKEATDGERLERGVVYVSPGSQNVIIAADGRIVLRPAPRSGSECPSANMAMTSVAQHSGSTALGVVLTGMGRDGAVGAEAIKRAGGVVIAQDEASSLVYGMPRAAVETGCVDGVFPLFKLPMVMVRYLENLRRTGGWRVGYAS